MRSTLKFLAGALLGWLLWFYATPAYDAVLCRFATPLLGLDHRLNGVIAERVARSIQGRSINDLHFPDVTIPADQLTYNVVLFAGLMAARRPTAGRAVIALLVLMATHLLAVTVTLESAFATKAASWSDQHYSGNEQDFWTAAEYVYRLAGMFGIAFATWWLALPETENADSRSQNRRRR